MYYRLTYQNHTGTSRKGDSFLCGDRAVSIGQTASCDIALPEPLTCEPAVFASILPNADGKGWAIVRRTDCHHIRINGSELGICRQIADGDTVAFTTDGGETTFKVSTHDDGNYDSAAGTVFRKGNGRKAIALAVGIAMLALATATMAVLHRNGDSMLRHDNLDRYDASVYHITVDSVYLTHDTVINGTPRQATLQAVAVEHATAGTCFLTSDGIFVTARHCVEPWITDDHWNGIAYTDDMPAAVRLATIAETHNKTTGRDDFAVKAHCIISRQMEQYDYYSTDFHFNKTRDQVVCLGTDTRPIYWRTIMPLASRRDMELGDFAYVGAKGLKGSLDMAGAADLQAFDRQADKDIAVIGFPINDNNDGDICVKVFGNSQHIDFKDSRRLETAGCIQMSAPVNPGNSGGPILARIGGETKVIGIVSKADGRASQGTFWAVPITEVTRLRHCGGKIDNDSITFRR